MSAKPQNEPRFRPRARLLLILGEELITNEIIAIVELVKNAYDADATSAQVILDNVRDKQIGKIIILDNGIGMTRQIIEGVWLEPATDFRRKQKGRGERTKKFGRLPLGEKGVGRFAVHKLGNLIELVTRSESGGSELVLTIDWSDFDRYEYLDQVPVILNFRTPEVFKDKKHGTRIIVKQLKRDWTPDMIVNLDRKIQQLSSPFNGKRDFVVRLITLGFEEAIEPLPTLIDVLDCAFYIFEGALSEKGILTYDYHFNHPLDDRFTREVRHKELDIKNPKYFGPREPICGPFKIRFYVLDRDRPVIRILRDEDPDLTRRIDIFQHQTGVRVYRDEFRIWPYGEPGDDWLKLDNRRIQNPTQKIGNDQILGVIEISEIKNSSLRDKTNREGLIENDAFFDFRELITGTITTLEGERRSDKDEVDDWLKLKRSGDKVIKGDPVEGAIDGLEKKIKEKGHKSLYEDDLNYLRNKYRETLEETLDPIIVAAGLGISYTLPIHEIRRNVSDLRGELKSLEITQSTESNIFTILEQIDEAIRGADNIIRRGGQEIFRLFAVVKDASDIMRLRLKRENIKLSLIEGESIQVKGKRNLLVTAILNLIDNSSYWLLLREKEREIRITVNYSFLGEPRITVADNGPGIQDDPELLLRPFFTRKPDGTGLGLHIVNRIMKSYKGKIMFLQHEDNEDNNEVLLPGANVSLVFPREVEIIGKNGNTWKDSSG